MWPARTTSISAQKLAFLAGQQVGQFPAPVEYLVAGAQEDVVSDLWRGSGPCRKCGPRGCYRVLRFLNTGHGVFADDIGSVGRIDIADRLRG